MEKVPFLRDIDDELEYSQSLELWIVNLTEHLAKLSHNFPHGALLLTSTIDNEHELMARLRQTNSDLKFVVETLKTVVADMAARRKRLADRAVGLADGVVDEESS